MKRVLVRRAAVAQMTVVSPEGVGFIVLHRVQVGGPDPHKGGHYISRVEALRCSDLPCGGQAHQNLWLTRV